MKTLALDGAGSVVEEVMPDVAESFHSPGSGSSSGLGRCGLVVRFERRCFANDRSTRWA